MTTATVLAIVAIGLFGLLFGVLLAMLGIMAFTLHRAAEKQKSLNDFAFKILAEQSSKLTTAMDILRKDMIMHLDRVDGNRLFEASLAIQKSSKEMAHSVATFSKLLFAQQGQQQGMAPMAGFPQHQMMDQAFSLEDERADDAYLSEQAGRWMGDSAAGRVGWAGQAPYDYQTKLNPTPPPEPRRPFGMPASNLSQWPAANPADIADEPSLHYRQHQASALDIEQAMAHDFTPGAVHADPFAALTTPPDQGDMQG